MLIMSRIVTIRAAITDIAHIINLIKCVIMVIADIIGIDKTGREKLQNKILGISQTSSSTRHFLWRDFLIRNPKIGNAFHKK
jgi:hypothetical protein